jgi:PAS domain S-box-containing protein
MTTELRKTGIKVIGDIPWGTHFCHFFETKEDLLNILIPYFKAGLENNEYCLWIVSDPLNEEEAREALRQAVPETEWYLAAGCIEIVPQTEWYLKGGTFMPDQVINGWNSKLANALAEGYDGMRVNGNEAWLTKEDWKDFAQYEKTLDATLANHRMIVLCSYPLAHASAAEILDVVHTHQFAIVRRKGEWEIVESPELKKVKAESQRLNVELEQRVVERTQELAALNNTLRREVAERQQVMEALRKSEERFAKAFHSSPATQVIVCLSDSSFLDVNDAFSQTFGYTRAEVIGRTAHELGLWVNPQEQTELMQRLREGRAVCNHEMLARTKLGGILDMLVSMERIELAGEPCILTTAYDITERKRMEEALRQSESNFRTLAEKSLQGIAIFQEQKMVYANPALSAI